LPWNQLHQCLVPSSFYPPPLLHFLVVVMLEAAPALAVAVGVQR
jgi:hypothetical protein